MTTTKKRTTNDINTTPVKVDRDDHRQLKILAAVQGLTLTEVITELLKSYKSTGEDKQSVENWRGNKNVNVLDELNGKKTLLDH